MRFEHMGPIFMHGYKKMGYMPMNTITDDSTTHATVVEKT